MRPRALMAACALLGSVSVVFGADIRTPPPGSGERRAIAKALHPPCERDLGGKVILKFTQLRVLRDWAIARVRPLRPNEKSVDYRQTKYREQLEAGIFDEVGEALLKREQGHWRVLEWRFGATDTEMAEWIRRHRAPLALVQ
jgi:hypothetical protein